MMKRWRVWLIWIGGWEKANSTGWHFRYDSGKWRKPYPVSLFRRITIYSGEWVDIRLQGQYMTINFRRRYAYLSRDGTPSRAHKWLWGTEADTLKW